MRSFLLRKFSVSRCFLRDLTDFVNDRLKILCEKDPLQKKSLVWEATRNPELKFDRLSKHKILIFLRGKGRVGKNGNLVVFFLCLPLDVA